MKVTLNIPDQLWRETKAAAIRDGITLSTLVEHGLRNELQRHHAKTGFRLRKASFKGNGLQLTALGRSWNTLRSISHGCLTD
jgi:hypothetical protein